VTRIAVVSDIHGNLTALEAVLADLRETSPDLILHGGDLADTGSSPAEIVDRIRDLGWPGVFGNTDEMLFAPDSLTAFGSQAPQLKAMFQAIDEMASFTRMQLGEERLAWLGGLPRVRVTDRLALAHARPDTAWRSPGNDATDDELRSVYEGLGRPVVVYGHIHRGYIRRIPPLTIANAGSVSLSHDGDPRASYVVIDDGSATLRRVEYDVEREIAALAASGMPHSEWIIRTLCSAAPQMYQPER